MCGVATHVYVWSDNEEIIGRPRHRRGMDYVGWIHLAQDKGSVTGIERSRYFVVLLCSSKLFLKICTTISLYA
jgi:hypothetical protein